jgi:hypothetical protein
VARATLVLLALLLALPGAVATERPREVSILIYHASPDPEAGAPDADPYSTLDTTFLTGNGTLRLPVTRFDGVALASDAPEGDPASASAHFQEMRRLLLDRQRQGSPLALRVDGRVGQGELLINVTVEPLREAPAWRIVVVLFEDGLVHEGGSGVRVHRFVARAGATTHGPVESPLGFDTNILLDPAWERSKLGVVAMAVAKDGDVLQSAAWLATQAAPTQQREKAVLVEHATATWCEPCAPSDEALALLASQYGFPPPSGSVAYAARSPWLALAGLAGGALLGALVVRRARR